MTLTTSDTALDALDPEKSLPPLATSPVGILGASLATHLDAESVGAVSVCATR
jgi:hypothetical protein